MSAGLRRLIRWGVAGLSVATLIGVVGLAIQPAAASCVGPSMTVSPAEGAAGTTFVVDGQNFLDGCNDTGVNGQPPAPTPPATGIVITFQQNGRTWNLGTVNAGSDYTFTFTTAVPLEANAGSAVVAAGGVTKAFTVTNARPATPIRRHPSVTG